MSEADARGEEEALRGRFSRSRAADAAARLRRAQPRQRPSTTVDVAATDVEATSTVAAESIKGRLQARLLDELGERNLFEVGEVEISAAVRQFVTRVLETEDVQLNAAERTNLADELVEETLGVGPLAPLLADPAVTDVLVNGPEKVYIERFGRLERTDVRFRDAEHVVRLIERIATRLGRRIDAAKPMLDARLPDGTRVNATLANVSIDGPTLSIRRFGRKRLRRGDLVRVGSASPEILQLLELAVRIRKNIIVSGGTGAGKSTLLAALGEAIPDDERVVTIEDTAELSFDQDHVVRLETRPANVEGSGAVTARDLLINALRMRPDRIIVGEVRSGEALDMLQALNTGHDGGMSTVHANSPRDALSRIETMVLMAGIDIPDRAVREQISSAIHLIVHVRRFEDGVRRIERVSELAGLEGSTILLQDIFRYRRTGRRGRHVEGHFEATGTVPRFMDDLRERSMEIPLHIFRKRDDHA